MVSEENEEKDALDEEYLFNQFSRFWDLVAMTARDAGYQTSLWLRLHCGGSALQRLNFDLSKALFVMYMLLDCQYR